MDARQNSPDPVLVAGAVRNGLASAAVSGTVLGAKSVLSSRSSDPIEDNNSEALTPGVPNPADATCSPATGPFDEPPSEGDDFGPSCPCNRKGQQKFHTKATAPETRRKRERGGRMCMNQYPLVPGLRRVDNNPRLALSPAALQILDGHKRHFLWSGVFMAFGIGIRNPARRSTSIPVDTGGQHDDEKIKYGSIGFH